MGKMEQKIEKNKTVGNNLKDLRKRKRLSQEKLCMKIQLYGCDISRTTYAKYENGELNIRISVLKVLKEIYNCTYDDIFSGV